MLATMAANFGDSEWEKDFKVGRPTVERSNRSLRFQPGWTEQGYTVMGWGAVQSAKNVQTLLNDYYTAELNQQDFSQLHHQLSQKLGNVLGKTASESLDLSRTFAAI
jgi:hypothetical protein